jgi:hypothetical protein
MRKIRKPVNPSYPNWPTYANDLRRRLEQAFKLYSCLYSGASAGPPAEVEVSAAKVKTREKALAKSTKRITREIRDIVADIACAFDVQPEATIVITKRSQDYHACLHSDSSVWGRGSSPADAIGDLVWAHPTAMRNNSNLCVRAA